MSDRPSGPDLTTYLARDRAIQMAQEDWRAGRIGEDQVIAKARQYEAYLLGKPVLMTDEAESSRPQVYP